MALINKEADIDVVSAAKKRIKTVFQNNTELTMSVSGGKDSICMMNLVYSLIQNKDIDGSKLTVLFIDEEAIFDDVERIVLDWRKKFMDIGVKFEWYCIQVKHYNCLNSLSEDETFICWDKSKRDVWIRPMPEFAIKSHPLLKEGTDNYQSFFNRIIKGKINLIGIRVAESFQRLQAISSIKVTNKGRLSSNNLFYPIYDWKDKDVWLYILNNKLDYPETYMYLYQCGVALPRLRLSQFFSVDTAKILVSLEEFYPDLMDRVVKREPNAYLLTLYWDTEIFRGTKKRKKERTNKNYKKEVLDMLSNPTKYFDTKNQLSLARNTKAVLMKYGRDDLPARYWNNIYKILKGGDPKRRTLRAIQNSLVGYSKRAIQNSLVGYSNALTDKEYNKTKPVFKY